MTKTKNKKKTSTPESRDLMEVVEVKVKVKHGYVVSANLNHADYFIEVDGDYDLFDYAFFGESLDRGEYLDNCECLGIIPVAKYMP